MKGDEQHSHYVTSHPQMGPPFIALDHLLRDGEPEWRTSVLALRSSIEGLKREVEWLRRWTLIGMLSRLVHSTIMGTRRLRSYLWDGNPKDS